MEELFGIVANLWPITDKEKHLRAFKDVAEFKGNNYALLATGIHESGIKDSREMAESHGWEIAQLIYHTRDNFFEILMIVPVEIEKTPTEIQ